MRFLKRFLIRLIILIAILVGIGLIIPSTHHVERSIVIDAPPDKVWTHIATFKAWESWSPWYARDPDAEFTYSGEGVGQTAVWKSDNRQVGSGSQEVTTFDAPSKFVTALDFGGHGQAVATFDLVPEASGTRVTWALDSESGNNLIARYFGLMLDKMVGLDYETGLANLKIIAEQ